MSGARAAVLTALLMLVAAPAHAQWLNIGVKGGVNVATQQISGGGSGPGVQPRVGVVAGCPGQIWRNSRARQMGVGPAKLYQNPPHHPGRHGAKMRPVVPRHSPQAGQADVGFIDERGGLQNMARALFTQMPMGDLSKLGIDQLYRLVEGILIAGHPGMK